MPVFCVAQLPQENVHLFSLHSFLHFKWNLVNVSFQSSQFCRFHYTSCCHFNEASSFQRVWEQNLFDDLSANTESSKYFPELNPLPHSLFPFENANLPTTSSQQTGLSFTLKPEGPCGAPHSMGIPGEQAGFRGSSGAQDSGHHQDTLYPEVTG